jgi:NitT/TauT family transport system permease protein
MRDFWSGSAARTISLVLVVVALMALWEAAVRIGDIKAFLLPAPSVVLQSIAQKPLWYLQHAYQTLVETFLGFAFAVFFGILIAICIVYSRVLEHSLYTFLVTMNAVPKIAIAPLFVVWLGTGLEPKVAVAALGRAGDARPRPVPARLAPQGPVEDPGALRPAERVRRPEGRHFARLHRRHRR